jgi:hypothetical protein
MRSVHASSEQQQQQHQQEHQQEQQQQQEQESGGGSLLVGGSALMEVSAIVTEHLNKQREHDEKLWHEFEAKLQEQRQETERQRQEAERLREDAFQSKLREQALRQTEQQRQEIQQVREVASARSCVSESQLELLQTRLDALHQAKLLTDDEIAALEDCVADYIDCRSSLNPVAAEIGAAAEKVKKMVGLSEGIGKDGMLARQLRRKLAAGQ